MDYTEFLDGVVAESRGRAVGGAREEERGMALELWRLRTEERPDEASFGAAERAGERSAEEGEGVEVIVRRALVLGRTLGRSAIAARLVDPAAAARIEAFTDEAAARAAAAHARFLRARRDDWLAFFAHEVKNPLNTVLNAIWLIREGRGGAGAVRFLGLAESAARRIETELHGLRDFEGRMRSPPPRWLTPAPPPPTGPSPR